MSALKSHSRPEAPARLALSFILLLINSLCFTPPCPALLFQSVSCDISFSDSFPPFPLLHWPEGHSCNPSFHYTPFPSSLLPFLIFSSWRWGKVWSSFYTKPQGKSGVFFLKVLSAFSFHKNLRQQLFEKWWWVRMQKLQKWLETNSFFPPLWLMLITCFIMLH